jgi:hypothetical protein
LTFEFFRFRFHFRAAGPLYFPPYKSGNIVRGAFGTIFRKLACVPGCTDAKVCEARSTCAYARIFEPRAARCEGPSGLADWPRPFVFRAAHLDGRAVAPGEAFYFDVHLFDVRDPALPHFVRAFAQLAHEGLGPGRGRADLVSVEQLGLDSEPLAQVFDGERLGAGLLAPNRLSMAPAAEPVGRIAIRFVTPTELKSGDALAERPEFGILFARLRDRIGALCALYGSGPLAIDFKAMGERAAGIRMTRCDIEWREAERLSSRTGQRHPIGGFVGEAEYEGALAEFIPFLRAGEWTGVGRQTVWGKGQIEVAV